MWETKLAGRPFQLEAVLGLNFSYEVLTGNTVHAGYEVLVGGEMNNKFNVGYRYSI